MEMQKNWSPAAIEAKWYRYWMERGLFRSVPDHRKPYTIVIPPPNVTGVLHMGHMLNNTIQDVLVRRARMMGLNACWVPGTDHASIATEARVVKMLADQGIKKSDLTRDSFLQHAFAWKEKYGGIILDQLKKLGASCDWERTRFTMEPSLSKAVTDVFIDLYKKGLIYRGVRMVNWDPKGLTAVSDEEVIHRDVASEMVYVRYPFFNDKESVSEEAIQNKLAKNDCIVIATVRPETIPGDTAVCVHPDDDRYKHLKGKKVLIPFTGRLVPLIFDTYIDPAFGTGALKVTPAHDINDYNLGQKHHVQTIDTLNPDGTMNENAGAYAGMDRFLARKAIVKDLEKNGYLLKKEPYTSSVGFSERTDAVIEPRLSMQWFLKMDAMAKPALDVVAKGEIKIVPEKFFNTYSHWMENVRDWCISRQLWWGQQIPAWYDASGDVVVAATQEEAIAAFKEKGKMVQESEIYRDPDVVDTWFSSWLWPISVFDGFDNPNNEDIRYYYPTDVLVTAPEILFFWVARMIMAGMEYRSKIPFHTVYLTGIVRDKMGRKMSKSLGNSPDPLELIERFGADGVRMGMLLCSPAGNDLPFDEALCEQGRNFNNKLWNAFRLVSGFETTKDVPVLPRQAYALTWFTERISEAVVDINKEFNRYRLSDCLMLVYKLAWDDFCSWFLEMVKPDFIDGKPAPIAEYVKEKMIGLFENLLVLLHPFIPFITEELWHSLKERTEGSSIMLAKWPDEKPIDRHILGMQNHLVDLVQQIRALRSQYGLSPKENLRVNYLGENPYFSNPAAEVVCKLAGLSEMSSQVSEPEEKCWKLTVDKMVYFIPSGTLVDEEREREKIEKELAYLNGFLESVNKKLGNEKFRQNAKPELLALEEKKQADAQEKIKLLMKQLTLH